MKVRPQPVEVPTPPVRQWIGRIRDALSSSEPGWIAQAFWLPALMGSLALLFYVETLTPEAPESLSEAGEEAEQGAPRVQPDFDLNHPVFTLRQRTD